MTRFENFDLLHSPLEGTNLIEASAGTGKTYAIAGLFLRLILERNLSVNEILVVTFTVPATEELRDRIRTKLREAIEAFSGGRAEDAFLNDLVRKYKDSAAALPRLGEALRAFDQAAIFTIHGFCMRMLHENAFESGSLFDTELVTDQENLKREIVDDFWRTHFYNASPLLVNYAINNKFSPDNLLSILANRDAQPYLKIIPQAEIPDPSLQEKEFREYFSKVRKGWQSARTEVKKILTANEGLSKVKYSKVNIPVWIQGMDDYMATGGNNPTLFQGFEKFTSSELQGAVKKSHTPPAHPFFELCETLREKQEELERVFDQCLLGLKAELFRYVHGALIRRKTEKNIQFFDDLLLKLYWALEEKGGKELARTMRMKFEAALIDEFQDTDPIQYAIFKKVFGTEKSILFLIGDPKQAIYSFRGADIFAYMDAARDVKSRYTLGENWRSEPNLITAINAIFSRADYPFVYDEIPFQSAAPAKNKAPESLRIDGQKDSPLQVWFLHASKLTEHGKAITKTQARELIPKAVAAETSRLISLGRRNRTLIGKSPLREGDIAVLVRTHVEARHMQKALSALNIPSVLYTTENLFDSHEALEMERVLAGINEPNNESLLKGALATDMMGVRGEELADLMENETGWEKWLIEFKRYHDLWNGHGFIQMFRYLVLEQKVLTRIMSLPDGERRSTNLLHLSEVLHQTSTERSLCMAGLLKWLSEQRDPSTPRLDEHQLRLESDENAVKLVTIHKSKGLEYPVVFCPFVWAGARIEKKKDPFTFHDELDHMRLTLDLGSECMDENRVCAEKEQLAENLRLLYVALTRARSRCYLIWGRFNEAETSAPAYLFHQQGSWEGENVVGATEERFKGLSDEDVISELKIILDKSSGTITLSEMPMERGKEYSPLPDKKVTLTCRKFSGDIDRQWHISSFSSLASGQPHGAELADRDPVSLPDLYSQKDSEESLTEEGPSSIFSFPRGTKAGTFLHDIFEHLDFAEKDTSLMKKLVANKLKEYGFELTWQEALWHTIQKVLSVPLEPERSDFTLSRIQNKDRLNELEFYFPLKSISPKKLDSIFAKYAGSEPFATFPERTERLDFAPVRGFMKGFMDMVFHFQNRFYLVDWKSNFLGSSVEHYDQEALAAAMKDEFYIIQYHIYTVALNQYLRLRLPGYNYGTHFGGVYYIFLRGVDPDRGTEFGIYRERPSGRFIKELSTSLIDQTEMVRS
jgi:exodeoxyribonuclease V beta subunit